MPKELDAGVLYVSKEFKTAAHLCACGCGSKIRTPLGPTEWSVAETDNGPSLSPSIGNWQLPCQSHYWINKGEIYWAEKWSPKQIADGRKKEENRRRSYYDNLHNQNEGILMKIWKWLSSLIRK